MVHTSDDCRVFFLVYDVLSTGDVELEAGKTWW